MVLVSVISISATMRGVGWRPRQPLFCVLVLLLVFLWSLLGVGVPSFVLGVLLVSLLLCMLLMTLFLTVFRSFKAVVAVAYDVGWHRRHPLFRTSLCWAFLFLLVLMMLLSSFGVGVVVIAVFGAFSVIVVAYAGDTIAVEDVNLS